MSLRSSLRSWSMPSVHFLCHRVFAEEVAMCSRGGCPAVWALEYFQKSTVPPEPCWPCIPMPKLEQAALTTRRLPPRLQSGFPPTSSPPRRSLTAPPLPDPTVELLVWSLSLQLEARLDVAVCCTVLRVGLLPNIVSFELRRASTPRSSSVIPSVCLRAFFTVYRHFPN